MAIPPTSSLARAVHAARVLCASSQTFVDSLQLYAPGVTDSMDRVFLYQAESIELKQPMTELRPMIVVGLSDNIEWNALMPGCSVINLISSGSVVAVVVQDVHFDQVVLQSPTFVQDDNFGLGATQEPDGTLTPGPDKQGDSYIDACNLVGGIVDDMSGVFGSSIDLRGFIGVSMLQQPMRPEIDERHNDDFWVSIIEFQFGDLPR